MELQEREQVLHDTETALLGALLRDPVTVRAEADLLTGAMFTSPARGEAWDAAGPIVEATGSLDMPTWMEAGKTCPWRNYRDEITAAMMSEGLSVLTNRYVATIHEAYVRRGVVTAANHIISMATIEEMDAGTLVESARKLIDDADETIVRGRSLADNADQWLADLGSQTVKRPVPWRALERAIGGLHGGGYYLISGIPGAGKSVMALNMATYLCRNGIGNVLYASTELQERDVMARLVSAVSYMPVRAVQDPGAAERPAVEAAVEKIRSWPNQVSVHPVPMPSVRQIRSQARSMLRQGPLAAVVVDYIQQIPGTDTKASEYDQIRDVSKGLVNLAKEIDVPVIVISSLNRNRLQRGAGSRLTGDDLRGSGTIGYDADVTLFLHRTQDDKDANQVRCYVDKNRQGEPEQEFVLLDRLRTMTLDNGQF